MKHLIIGVINLIFLILNTFAIFCPIMIVAILKLATPFAFKFWNFLLVGLAEQWIRNNNLFFGFTLPTQFKIMGETNFDYRGNYIMIANHQTWLDIIAMQYLGDKHKLPYMRFFIKKELIYVPLMGLAWWALDFPRLNRYNKEYLKKHPEKKGKDIEAMMKACKKFADIPSTVTIYPEGTRFTEGKYKSQSSPYENLLKPKSGGLATAIAVLKHRFSKIVDVSLHYPNGIPGFWDFLSGKVPEVIIQTHERKVPKDFFEKDYFSDEGFKEEFNSWVSKIWKEKDEILKELRN